jgi:hypothetical protein
MTYYVNHVTKTTSWERPPQDDHSSSAPAPAAAVRPASVRVDTTGDGYANALGFDTTGDGRIDSLDLTGDGRINCVLRSISTSPVHVNTAGEGTTGDRHVNAVGCDTNRDERVHSLDSSGDGSGDRVLRSFSASALDVSGPTVSSRVTSLPLSLSDTFSHSSERHEDSPVDPIDDWMASASSLNIRDQNKADCPDFITHSQSRDTPPPSVPATAAATASIVSITAPSDAPVPTAHRSTAHRSTAHRSTAHRSTAHSSGHRAAEARGGPAGSDCVRPSREHFAASRYMHVLIIVDDLLVLAI